MRSLGFLSLLVAFMAMGTAPAPAGPSSTADINPADGPLPTTAS
ncbi:hypothetical protein GGP93_000444 [Salinibacter ruber]|nr:hypothetical protein [Salinibacter ruber]